MSARRVALLVLILVAVASPHVLAHEIPSLCSAEQSGCRRPWCKLDGDCRIPFLSADGTLGADAASEAPDVQPRCLVPDQGGPIGRCSHGLVGQRPEDSGIDCASD